MITRRSFLGTILALGCAPAIVKANSLMQLARPQRLPIVYGRMRLSGTVIWSTGIEELFYSIDDKYMYVSYNLPRADIPIPTTGIIEQVWATDRFQIVESPSIPIPLESITITDSGDDRILSVKNIDLTPFHNRVPDFSYQINTGDII